MTQAGAEPWTEGDYRSFTEAKARLESGRSGRWGLAKLLTPTGDIDEHGRWFEQERQRWLEEAQARRENEIATSILAQLCGPMGRVTGDGRLTHMVFLADPHRASVVTRLDLALWPELWKQP